MNPVTVIVLAAMGVVGIAGFSTLPPESAFEQTTPYVDPWSDFDLTVRSDGGLGASESVETAPEGICPPIYALALSEGFSEAEAGLLDRIAWHESRCQRDAIGDNGNSLGMLQIHAPSWCKPNRWNPVGYLQAALILETCDELFDPVIAVRAARAIVNEGGFEQWSTYRKALQP